MNQSRSRYTKRHSPPKEKTNDKEVFQYLLDKCLAYLSVRPRTQLEIESYLSKLYAKEKIKTHLAGTVIGHLKKHQLVDDSAFIDWWVGQRNRFRPKGSFILKKELLDKGVARETVDDYFDTLPPDEESLARAALESKRRILSDLATRKRFQRAMEYLARRGFNYHVSKKVFEEMFALR